MSNTIPSSQMPEWEQKLHSHLPLYGHRNWILVADAAYPSQCAAGVETIVADAHQLEVIQKVVDAIAASEHVGADIYVDEELAFLSEEDAPGIDLYRQHIAEALHGFEMRSEGHEQLIAKLDQAAKTFHVLIIKTKIALPYTSIFFELNCKYWSSAREERLRLSIASRDKY